MSDPLHWDFERFAPVLAPLGVAAIAAAIILANPLGLLLLLVGLALLALSCWSARDGFLLFGPFPRIELLRTIRKQRVHLWRGVVAGVVGLGLAVGYGFVAYGDLPRHRVAFISTMVFFFVAWNLFLIVFSVTITMMSYAIAEDRDGKRLDFVLASDLRGREIVLGKFVGRLITSLAYLAALLPFALLLPVLFGVDPEILVFLFGLCLVTILSLAGLAILASASAATKKAGGTVLTIYVLPYFLLAFGLSSLKHFPQVWFFPGSPQKQARYAVSDLSDLVNVGNPIHVIQAWTSGFFGSGVMASMTADFQWYAAFHVATCLLALLIAAWILRQQSAKLADKVTAVGQDVSSVPSVTDRPVLWKERYFAPAVVKTRRSRPLRLLGTMLVIPPCLIFIAAGVSDLFGYALYIQEASRILPAILIWIFAVAGSRFGLEAIVRERDKDTLTSLLCTDLSAREIVIEKMLGILRIMAPAWLAVGAVAASACVAGGMVWWTALAAFVMVCVFGTFFILLGLHTSAKAKSLEATTKVFGWKLAPFAILPPICLIALVGAPKATPDYLWIGGLIVAGILLVYIVIGWYFWHAAIRRFETACDPASEAGPMLASAAANP